MKSVDANVHLSDEEYAEDIDDVITETKNSNVVNSASNSTNYETSLGSLE